MFQSSDLITQRNNRIQKAQQLRLMGIDPYPSHSYRDTSVQDILQQYDQFHEKEVIVAGRLMSWREHGQLVFGDIQDPTGRLQLYIRQEDIADTSIEQQCIGFNDLELFDVGDIAEAIGIVTKTKRGEISVLVKQLKMLAKSIRPLPDKWSGLQDPEKLMRQRYLDMIMHPEKKEVFIKAEEVLFAMRTFLHDKGFVEIKTPILQPVYGGGTANPFKTHVHALGADFYLAIAHELYLKRLIVAGFENVYNITGYFRNEGIDRTHNPEFRMLETMTAYKNYEYNMDLIEEMYQYIAQKVFNRTVFDIEGEHVDFSQPWERIMMIDAVKKYAGYDFETVTTLEQAHTILDEIGYEKPKPNTIGESMTEVFAEKVETQLIQPTFVTGHPVEISPLAKRMNSDPRFVERFEIFIGGVEGGDNWSELNDPLELFERFKDQMVKRDAGDEEAHPMDIEFIETMEYGMPPTTGLGPGIERLTMMFLGKQYIDDIIFFPMLRPAPVTKMQRDIYGDEVLGSEAREGVESKQIDGLPSRKEALSLLEKHVHDEYQRLHANMVANVLEKYAEKFGTNQDLWYTTGLLHDLDYDEFPDEHPHKSVEWFTDWKYPKGLIQAVQAHAHQRTGVEPVAKLDFALMAVDELSGLLYAYSKMREDGFGSMESKGVKKKLKDKSFAAKIDRTDVYKGIEGLGVELYEHIALMVEVFGQMEELK